jgi:hypothetical protein
MQKDVQIKLQKGHLLNFNSKSRLGTSAECYLSKIKFIF